tara:strand:- start:1311 stop:2063 length:753 start_codon:yes stop_codon:yes gene_type:complete
MFDVDEEGSAERVLFGVRGLACHDCVIAFEGIEVYTNELEGNMTLKDEDKEVKQTTSWPDNKPIGGYKAPTPNTPATTPAATSTKPYVAPTGYKGCGHHLQPFKFEGYEVYLTGSSHTKEKALSAWPDAGVYLASNWFKGAAASTDGFDLGTASWPSLFIDWPDMGAISIDLLEPCIEWAKARLEKKERLEIACVGGHGRTGTYAVALMISMGMDTLEAFNLIRDKYCSKAVESREQAELLVKWAKYLKT